MSDKTNTLQMLSAMNQAQMQQLMAANLLAIAVCMKTAGVNEITISPEEIGKIIEPGETLEPFPNVDGGFTYRFVKHEKPLAKKPVPMAIKAPAKKGRKAGKR